jgi:hypothetical protein
VLFASGGTTDLGLDYKFERTITIYCEYYSSFEGTWLSTQKIACLPIAWPVSRVSMKLTLERT